MAARRKEDVGRARYAVDSVDKMITILRQMLERASLVKDSTGIEPALTNAGLEDLLQNVESFHGDDPRKARQNSLIETAVRSIFNELLASSSIDDPSFVRIWNLLDIVSVLSDTGRCEPPFAFHLIEELLDSQTVAGCRIIFDYLESRRERLIAKHFSLKNLVILRSCNELLRRLSRAEDTAFCGRVYIFMFQSFPLGDKSSVNLRGEYHVENVTIFDELLPSPKASPDAMQVDTDDPASQDEKKNTPGAVGTPNPVEESKNLKGSPSVKGVTFDAKVSTPAENPKDPNELYPIFWSLQHSFNQPKKLFDPEYFKSFKSGLQDTMVMFKSVPNAVTSKTSPDKQNSTEIRGTKRKKSSSSSDDLASTFNPKYLTSRDLFELEISDLSFRRHILVQALIILDFLLSLSSKAKEKLTTVTKQNASVMYSEQVISEEDTKWALDMKRQIAEYLKVGLEGAFFLRMVETVLSRDKNWVRWKMESCTSIQRPPVDPHDVISAKAAAQKATAYRPIRPHPLRSLDLGFLSETSGGLERLRNPDRFRLPTLASFEKGIADDDFEIGMTNDAETKERLQNAKASKTWRALRIARKTKLSLFEKIEDTMDIRKIFEDDSALKAEETVDGDATEGETAEGETAEGADAMEVDEVGTGKALKVKHVDVAMNDSGTGEPHPTIDSKMAIDSKKSLVEDGG